METPKYQINYTCCYSDCRSKATCASAVSEHQPHPFDGFQQAQLGPGKVERLG